MIAHDIRVTGHDTFPSKAIHAISIDCPRDMWRINRLTGSRSPLLQFPTLGAMTKKKEREREKTKKKKKKKNKSLSIYLNSKRKHEASDVESS